MASLINRFYHKAKNAEQSLYNRLITESIQLMGNTYQYLPRNLQLQDLVMGEDIISSFDIAIPVEMYLSNPMGFEGDKEMFSKFGLELRNSYKLVVSKSRWEQEVKTQFDTFTNNGEANFSISDYIRPREGDLIFDPLTNYLMEIKFVDHDKEFYALGKNYMYYLSCEAFAYQNEIIDTGVAVIDIFQQNSTDELINVMRFENGDQILLEQGGYLLIEDEVNLVPFREYGTDFEPSASTIQLNIFDPFA